LAAGAPGVLEVDLRSLATELWGSPGWQGGQGAGQAGGHLSPGHQLVGQGTGADPGVGRLLMRIQAICGERKKSSRNSPFFPPKSSSIQKSQTQHK